jgi:hypothetical protein
MADLQPSMVVNQYTAVQVTRHNGKEKPAAIEDVKVHEGNPALWGLP